MPVNGETNRVLRVIQKHPEGIEMVELGNALGVNWRTLISAVGSLLEEGKVGKLDSIYYPILSH